MSNRTLMRSLALMAASFLVGAGGMLAVGALASPEPPPGTVGNVNAGGDPDGRRVGTLPTSTSTTTTVTTATTGTWGWPWRPPTTRKPAPKTTRPPETTEPEEPTTTTRPPTTRRRGGRPRHPLENFGVQ